LTCLYYDCKFWITLEQPACRNSQKILSKFLKKQKIKPFLKLNQPNIFLNAIKNAIVKINSLYVAKDGGLDDLLDCNIC